MNAYKCCSQNIKMNAHLWAHLFHTLLTFQYKISKYISGVQKFVCHINDYCKDELMDIMSTTDSIYLLY